MRFYIALKFFFGFLVIIALNVFFLVIISKLTDLNVIVTILKHQNDVKNHILTISNLHTNQTRSEFIFKKLRKEKSAQNFEQTGAAISTLIDSTLYKLHEVFRLDTMVSAGADSLDPALYQLIECFAGNVKTNNVSYNTAFADYVKNADAPKGGRDQKHWKMVSEILVSSEEGLRAGLATADSLIDIQTKTRIRDVDNRVKGMRQLTLIIVTGISVFSLLFGILFSRAITNSLRRLRESAQSIAKGNFDFNPRGYPKDEIGDLAVAFFDMAYDLKRMQEELVKSKRLAAIGQIVASVNHEINNPLMIISGNAQFLEMTMEGYPADMKERVKAILEETERISQVTRKLREIKNPIVEDYTASGEQMINLDKSSL